MVEPLVIGLDIGNAIVKVYEARRKWDAPNVIDYRCDQHLVEGHGETADSWLDVEISSSPAVAKSTRLYFGDLAVRRGASARPLVTAKLKDEQTAISFVAALARTAANHLKMMPKADRDAYVVGDRLVVPMVVGVGAPVHQFEDQEAKKAFAARVKGRHVIRFIDTPGLRDLGPIELVVDRILLYQEGVSALADYRYDDAGALRRRGQLNCYAAVVDPGANTLDWATTKQDGAVDSTLTGGRNLGLAEAMDQLTAAINAKYERRYTRAQLVSELMDNKYTIPAGSQRIDVWDQAQLYLQRVADEVLGVVRKLQNDSLGQIGLFIFAGGGAAALRPFLEAEFEGESYRGVDVEWLSDPLHANAAGYYKRTVAKLAEERPKAGGAHA